MHNPYSVQYRRIAQKRTQRITRLIQKFDLWNHRETIYHTWAGTPAAGSPTP